MSAESISLWRERIADRQNNSGIKLKEWCELNQLTKHAYYYWKQRITELDQKEQTVQAFTEISLPDQSRYVSEVSGTGGNNGILVRWKEISIQLTDPSSTKLAAEFLVWMQQLC